jgi:hypothetical protein
MSDFTRFGCLPMDLIRSFEPYLQPKYATFDLSIEEYENRLLKQFPSCGPIAKFPQNTRYVCDKNSHQIIIPADTKDRIALLEIDYGHDIRVIKCEYSLYKLTIPYISTLDEFLSSIKEGKSCHFKTISHFASGLPNTLFWDANERTFLTQEGSFVARGQTVNKIIEWLIALKESVPEGYILERRFD